MILISAGTFTMGSDSRAADEKPMHKVYLEAYYIGKYEVTNAEYYEFWKLQPDSPQKTPQHTPENFTHLPHIGNWPARAKQFPSHPVVGISWHDAKAYAGMERHAAANRSGMGKGSTRLHR